VPAPFVLLDDATPGRERLLRFAGPKRVIEATQPDHVPAALRAIEEALTGGEHVAGWMSYELGYVLEPRLNPCQWPQRELPLLWFGVFGAPEQVEREGLNAAGRAYAGPLRHEWDEAAYSERFAKVHDYIEAGESYQANLSFRSGFHFVGDAMALYLELRDRAASPHGGFIDDGARKILSLSPELFFNISARGEITARPMKGTAPRGADELSDARSRAALASSAKDRAENLMIVDLLRNDVGRLALIGSVGVPDLFSVETYPTLHTLVSTVTAQLKPATRADAIVRALFPCGSVTGAPKIRAMEIIRELEQSPRGAYCGAIGHFAPDGSANFNVAIRTLTISGNRGELGIGGAVVQDSTAKSEYAECLLKARYFEDTRRQIGLIETLRFDQGFVRRDRHLARMQHSAACLGLPFDWTEAIRTLHYAVDGAREALRVRLMLDESGQFSCTMGAVGPQPSRWSFAISPHAVNSGDELLRHKTTWRAFYDDEQARLAKLTGCDEALFLNERGEVAECSRTNIFVKREGRLITPPLSAGVLNGVLRSELIEKGKCVEETLMPRDLEGEVLVGNSLRGLIPGALVQTSALARGA
jgi:para-aminobenzoate synthetase / 4-amino-4-deoxychorismate lyase